MPLLSEVSAPSVYKYKRHSTLSDPWCPAASMTCPAAYRQIHNYDACLDTAHTHIVKYIPCLSPQLLLSSSLCSVSLFLHVSVARSLSPCFTPIVRRSQWRCSSPTHPHTRKREGVPTVCHMGDIGNISKYKHFSSQPVQHYSLVFTYVI